MSGSDATVDTTEGVRSEEEVQKEQSTSDLKESSADVGLLDQPLILEGKRKRKSVESFQASTATPAKKKRPSISDGHGRRLGDLNLDFGNRQSDELRPLYRLLFNTPGQVRSIKRHIGDFCGFTFERDDPEFSKRRASLAKFQKQGLVTNFCKPLGLSVGGSKDEVIDRILEFLLKPSGQAEKVTPKSTGKKRARKAKASPEKEDEQQEVADEDGLEGGKEEEEEKHDDESLKNAEGMDEQEAEKKQDEVEEEDKEVVEKEEDMEAVEKEEDEKAVEKEEDEEAAEKEEDMEAVGKEEDEKAVEKEEDAEAVEKEEDEEAVGREEEETGVGEAQAESAEKQEETEDKQERTVVTEDPPHECEKEGTEVEGKQGDNGVAGGEVPGGCDQEMDTSTAPTSAESAKKVHVLSVEDAGNHQAALEQVKAED